MNNSCSQNVPTAKITNEDDPSINSEYSAPSILEF